jgi:hypothetical protein
MTKMVRIENADTCSYPVRVTYQSKDADGNWVDESGSTQLDYPTKLGEFGIHSSRRVVVEERPADPPKA